VPADVSIAVISFIPELFGYHKHRLDVLKLTLESIIANTEKPYDLMIFDNGSCGEVNDYLSQLNTEGQIQYLFLSQKNIGKIGAMQILFHAAPGKYIAYADDDVFFYPGWLPAHMNIMSAYPSVGMVSGVGVRNRAERSSKSLEKYMQSEPDSLTWTNERRLPDSWEIEWANSTGRDPAEYLEKTKDKLDLILKLNGVEAFAGANHFQFLAPKDALINSLPENWTGRLMGEMMELDDAVDQQGLLRLSTAERYAKHIGNIVSDELKLEAGKFGININSAQVGKTAKKHWLLRIPGMGRVFWKIYDWLFRVLHKA
jgi:glycosyltransferase involved in cell wall biosynthesis